MDKIFQLQNHGSFIPQIVVFVPSNIYGYMVTLCKKGDKRDPSVAGKRWPNTQLRPCVFRFKIAAGVAKNCVRYFDKRNFSPVTCSCLALCEDPWHITSACVTHLDGKKLNGEFSPQHLSHSWGGLVYTQKTSWQIWWVLSGNSI